MHPNQTSFIFAYGGLMLAESRQMTLGKASTALPIPVMVHGVERFWGFPAPAYQLTTVALRPNPHASCAGVIVPITARQLVKLDRREAGYHRITVDPDQIQFLDLHAAPPKGTIDTYVADQEGAPSAENPIVQSDLDAILTGCLHEHGEAFAKQVLQTTRGWDAPWVNDRAQPRYPYALHHQAYIPTIDRLLTEMGYDLSRRIPL